MTTGESSTQAVRQQLEQILASAGFSGNDRRSRFLRFVVEAHLNGRNNDIKESVIAMEVFGSADYDPKQDSIVRTEAGRLRARLAEYYAGEGRSATVIIELPKGSYVPSIRHSKVGQALPPAKSIARRLHLMATLAAAAVALAVLGWWWLQAKNAPIAIAVLPLENVSHDPEDDYFANGLTGEMIRNLSEYEGLEVRSRTSSFALKEQPRNVREAGKQLAVDYVLEGSTQRAGNQLRISVQLIRVHDDISLWSGKFDRELTDIFAIQDEISREVVNNLRLKLVRGRRRYETSVEAYDLYLRAQALEINGQTGGKLIKLYGQAIEKDPSFAPAYAGLAGAYTYETGTYAGMSEEGLANMRAAAEKALQFDPLLGGAHQAMGNAQARDSKWEQSEKSFRRAIELEPSNSLLHTDFAMNLLLVLGRIEEAVQQERLAVKADPLSPDAHYCLAYALTSSGSFNEAAEHCQKLPAENYRQIVCMARVRIGQGRAAEAIQILSASKGSLLRAYLGLAYGKAGRREDAEQMALELSPRPFQQALVFAGLGDKDRSLEALDRMTTLGPIRIGRTLSFPEMAFLRGDPRLKPIRKKVGLPQ